MPGPPGAINLPKSPAGGASGPGASAMVSPGDGAGIKAHVESGIREHIKGLVSLLGRLEPNSKEFKTVARAMNDLTAVFGKPADVAGVPKPAGPVGNAPPPGIGGPPKGIPTGPAGAGSTMGGALPAQM